MRLRVGLAAAVVLGLGGTLAPGYAKDIAPLPVAMAITTPVAGSADISTSPALATTDAASGDDSSAWQTVGRGMASWYGNDGHDSGKARSDCSQSASMQSNKPA